MASPKEQAKAPPANSPPAKVEHAAPHGATHEAVGAPEHGHAGGVFPPFDPTSFAPQLVWLALTFGFLYYALSRKLLPRVSQAIEDRAQTIRNDLDEAEHLKSETESSLKAYEQALATAKADAAAVAKSQRDALTAESDRERAAVDAQMAAKVADAEKRIAASKTTEHAAVTEVATQIVGSIVTKLTGQTVSSDEIAKAVAAVRAK